MEHDVYIRLRANGVLETTQGVKYVGQEAEQMAAKLDAAAAQLRKQAAAGSESAKGSREAAGATQVLGGALREAANDAAAMLPLPGAIRVALLGMTGALGVAATAALALGSIYALGAAEAQEYRRAIVLTGNAAGVTTDRLADMARAVAAAGGSQSQAAASLAQLVASGRVGSESLQRITQQAQQLERVAGVSIDRTIATYVRLGEAPVKASVELNKTTNYLTASLYEQIRALEKQGRTAEAAAVAQGALLDATAPRIQELTKHIGWVERGWQAVLGTVTKVKEEILDLGRQETTQQQLDALRVALAMPAQRGRNPLMDEQRREGMRQRQAELQELQRLERRGAELQATQAAATRDYIAQREAERDKKAGAGRTAADPSARLDDAIQRRLALAQAELQAGEQLSQADRFRIDLLQQIDDVQAKIGQRRAAELRTAVESTAQQMRAVELQRAEAKEREAAAKAFAAEREAASRQAYAGVQQLAERNRALAEETATIGLSAQALEARRQAQIDAEIADREAHLTRIDGLPAYAEEAAALRQQIELLRQRKALQAGKATAEAQDQERKADEQRRDGIADSITQGLMDGFRNGRSLTDIFLREMQAQFAATVLRPTVNYLVEGALGSGGSGGLLGQAFGFVRGLFGGGLASGGAAQRGRLYEVNETGLPEVVTVGARSFVMMGGQDGQVSAARGGGGGATAATPAARSIVYSPTTYIDSRTDRAEVAMLMERSHRQAMAQLVEMMDRGQV